MTKSKNMKRNLNILLFTLLGGTLFAQQPSSTVLQHWLKDVKEPVTLSNPLKSAKNGLNNYQNKSSLVYCEPEEIATPEEITNVLIKTKLNTIFNHASENNTAIGYEDFSAISGGKIGQTSDYIFTFQGDTKGQYYSSYTIAIDYNQDGIFGAVTNDDFYNTREIIKVENLLFNSTGKDGKSVSQTVIVPQDAVLGETRMRIMKRQTDKKSALHPKNGCDLGSTYGQIEEYSITIVPPSVCTSTPNGALLPTTYIPVNGRYNSIAKDAAIGSYVDVFVYEGNNYYFESSNKNVFVSLKDVVNNVNLGARYSNLNWISDRTGVVRLYLHSNENCELFTEKTDLTLLVRNPNRNPINEPCNLGIPSVNFQLTKELGGTTNQEIALDLNAYSGRGATISGIKLNLQGDATKVDFELLEDTNGLPSTTTNKIVGKIVSKNLIGTFNGKKSYQYDIDFDKPIVLDALESEAPVKKWLKIVTDAQALEVNTNFVINSTLAIKNSKDSQGKWSLDVNSEAVYQLKSECQYNMCKQTVPDSPNIVENGIDMPYLEITPDRPVVIDVIAKKGSKLEITGMDISAWNMLSSIFGGSITDGPSSFKLKLLSIDPKTGKMHNMNDVGALKEIEIASTENEKIQSLVYNIAEGAIAVLIKKKIKVKFSQPLILDGDKSEKYWLVLNDTQNISFWDTNANVDAVIGDYPKKFVLEASPPDRPTDDYLDQNSEIVYKLNTVCGNLGTTELQKLEKVKVSPNPFKDQVVIESFDNIKQLEVYNMAGLRVTTKETNSKTVQLNLGHLSPGVYIVKIVDDKGKVNTQKIIKK